jgi:hypothetical protein
VVCGRPVLPGEPRWLDLDLALALAYRANAGDACSGCGHPLDEALDPATEGHVEVEVARCHFCAARDRKSRALSEDAHEGTRPHPEILDGLFLAPRHD